MKKKLRSILFFISFVTSLISFIVYLNSTLPELATQISQLPNLQTTLISVTPSPSVLGEEASVEGELAIVKKVIDGDTIELENGQTLRYIGIDTPESKKPNTPIQCFAIAASAKNKELVEGKQVRLVKDISNVDRYGRILRYVYIGDHFINDLLVKEGYAFARSYPPDITQQELLKNSEKEAREESRGLWASCSVSPNGKKPEWIIK